MNDITAVARFAALGQPVRLALLAIISECDGTQNVLALTDRLCQRIGREIEQSTISYHLAWLRRAGFIERYHPTNEAFYTVCSEGLALCMSDLTELARGKQLVVS
jgi:DNA-binding transcriptional ArsR family regulator